MKRPRKPLFDPVAEYDGLVQFGADRITPEERSRRAAETLTIMERHPGVTQADREANATPVGGMQFR